MDDIRCVGIISKPHSQAAIKLVPELFEWLRQRGIEARYDVETAKYLGRADGIGREVDSGNAQHNPARIVDGIFALLNYRHVNQTRIDTMIDSMNLNILP